MENDTFAELRKLVQRVGLKTVIGELADICFVEESEATPETARAWHDSARALLALQENIG